MHSSLGSYDVEVETKEAIYIFEFKMGGSLKMQSLKSKKQTMQKNIVPATKVSLLEANAYWVSGGGKGEIRVEHLYCVI